MEDKRKPPTLPLRRPSCLPQPQQEPYPWLLYQEKKDYNKKLFKTILGAGDELQCDIPEFNDKQVIASFRGGWLLLVHIDDDIDHVDHVDGGVNNQNNNNDHADSINYSKRYTLWNSCSYKSFNLPPLNLSHDQKINCYLLLSDDDYDYGGGDEIRREMVTLLLFERTMPCIFYYKLRLDDDDDGGDARDGIWRSIGYAKQIQAYHNSINDDNLPPACVPGPRRHPQYVYDPVCCNGKLYALVNHAASKLVEIELNMADDINVDDGNGLVITPLGCDVPQLIDISYCFLNKLVEVDGELFKISIVLGGIDETDTILAVGVFRLNFSTWTWAKVDSIDNRVLFVCEKSQGFISSKARPGKSGNLIYCTSFFDDKLLYCYNMEDNSVSLVSCPRTSLPTPTIPPIWVSPDDIVVNDREENVSSLSFIESANNSLQDCDTEETSKEVVKETLDILGLLPGVLGDISDKLMLFDYKDKLTGTEEELDAYLSSSAWLVVPGYKANCDKDIWSFRDPHNISSKYLMTAPELLKDAIIRSSKGGWLLLSCSKPQDTIVFFNPFTKAMITLPAFDHVPPQFVGFSFSSSPTSDECVVVAITFERFFARVAIFASGMDRWDIVGFRNKNHLDFRPNFNNPVFWNGAFYFLGQDGNLGVLKFNGVGDSEWEVLDKPKGPRDSFRENFLVECNGELVSVFVGNMGNRVDVFKLSLSKSEWEKLDSLGNYVVYISRFSSFATLAKSPRLQNRIYFPRFKGESLVYYSLDTGKFHSVGSDDSFTDYIGTREQLMCGWIEPRLF